MIICDRKCQAEVYFCSIKLRRKRERREEDDICLLVYLLNSDDNYYQLVYFQTSITRQQIRFTSSTLLSFHESCQLSGQVRSVMYLLDHLMGISYRTELSDYSSDIGLESNKQSNIFRGEFEVCLNSKFNVLLHQASSMLGLGLA